MVWGLGLFGRAMPGLLEGMYTRGSTGRWGGLGILGFGILGLVIDGLGISLFLNVGLGNSGVCDRAMLALLQRKARSMPSFTGWYFCIRFISCLNCQIVYQR